MKPVWIKRGMNQGLIVWLTDTDAATAVADKWGSLTEIGWATPDSVLLAMQAETVNWASWDTLKAKYENPTYIPT